MSNGIVTTYDDGTRAEDVFKQIICITPTKTPFMSGIKKGTASNTLHEWVRDTLNPRADNAVIEGAAFTYSKRSVPTRSNNITQMFDKTFDVSSTQQWVKKVHNQNNEFDRQKRNALVEIGTDIDYALMRGSKASGNDSVARRLAGVLNFITTNYTNMASGCKLSESLFNDWCELCYQAGGDPDEAYTNSFLKRVISSWTAGATKNIDSKDKRLTNAINVYENDFQIIKTFVTLALVNTANLCEIVIIENARWKMAVGEEPHVLSPEEVGQTSHSKKGVIRGELTLEALAEEANGAIVGLQKVF